MPSHRVVPPHPTDANSQHDDRYYTSTESDTALALKASAADVATIVAGNTARDASILSNSEGVDRVDPGSAGTIGQFVRYRGGAPVLDDPLAIDLRDDGIDEVTTNNTPDILTGLDRAGWNTGRSGGTLAILDVKPVQIPAGIYKVGAEIAVHKTWYLALSGIRSETWIWPTAAMDSVLYLMDVSHSTIEGLYFLNPGLNTTIQDVIRLDTTDGSNAATGDVFRDIFIGDLDFVRGLTIGMNSSTFDTSMTTMEKITVLGGWTIGEATLFQEGIHLGSTTSGNVLNMAVAHTIINGCRYGVYIDRVNATLRDVWFNGGTGGEACIKGIGYGDILYEGGRIEGYDKLLELLGTDTVPRMVTIRDVVCDLNVDETGIGVAVERAGNLLFENITWKNLNYPTTKKQIQTGGNRGRKITLRNFAAQESPEEIWWYYGANGFERKFCHVVLDGYVHVDSSLATIAVYSGLYDRTITGATDGERQHILPFDGFVTVDTSAGAIAPEVPFGKWMVGRELHIKQSGANACTITAQSGETVGGGATLVPGNGVTVHLMATLTGWRSI